LIIKQEEQEDIYTKLKSCPKNDNEISIAGLLEKGAKLYNVKEPATDNNDDSERFNAIINFPNFLLQILRIQTEQDIALDDKRLLESFEEHLLKKENKTELVRKFGYNLLKGKFLFDKYIIKREYTKGTDHWSLKSLKYNETVSYVNTFGNNKSNDDINREILMLLSMFHVSAPTLVYKHWLNGALKYVFENKNVAAEEYKSYLENLARAFLHNRYLSSSPTSYYNIIYGTEAVTKNSIFNRKHTEDEIKKLDCGTAVKNFIFNFLDYLLWKNYRNDGKLLIKDFEFTFRSSVEHYYPQHPIVIGSELKEENEKWLDNFGNLCLISSSKNSRLSNYSPDAKKQHYKNNQIDSVKQKIMMKYASWDINEIEEHGNEMKGILLNS
jgi:hypothetical protein